MTHVQSSNFLACDRQTVSSQLSLSLFVHLCRLHKKNNVDVCLYSWADFCGMIISRAKHDWVVEIGLLPEDIVSNLKFCRDSSRIGWYQMNFCVPPNAQQS